VKNNPALWTLVKKLRRRAAAQPESAQTED
jgi:hypothetical protein